MKNRTKLALATTASALLIGFTTSPSQAAAQAYATCYTSPAGASGSVSTSGWKSGDRSIPSLTMKLYDEAPDNHHVRIRLVVMYADTHKYFGWHHNYDGWGTYKEFPSHVSQGGNIFDVGIQAAVFEGDRRIDHCTKWVSGGSKDPS
ncbi:hypothetical protein [Streptomyces sp. NRRL B-1140]|uniref:hypothetical protein n=1 Tax=Streptomyces sp. NRRL B-1140 TaxID=1415549 RepID=UPI000A8A77B3|nr:hypothetical protein [Streptomyces sp. NRRL B-1140]